MSQKISQKDDNPFAFFGALAEVFTACFPQELSRKGGGERRDVQNKDPFTNQGGFSSSRNNNSPSSTSHPQHNPQDGFSNLFHAFTLGKDEYEAQKAIQNTIEMLSGDKEVKSGVLSNSLGRVAQPATQLYTNVTGENVPFITRTFAIIDTIMDIKVPDQDRSKLSNALEESSRRGDLDQNSRDRISKLNNVFKNPSYDSNSTIRGNINRLDQTLYSGIIADRSRLEIPPISQGASLYRVGEGLAGSSFVDRFGLSRTNSLSGKSR